MTPYYTTAELAEFLDVSVETVKSWRSPEYEHSPLRLVGERYKWNRYRYSAVAVRDFISRNPRYRDKVAALFAPANIYDQLQGQPI